VLWGYLGFVFPCAMLHVATILREKGKFLAPSLSLCPTPCGSPRTL
jgi:hypothetical protein